jgi:GTPase
MFIDQVKIKVKSGTGGAGSTSFRREKYAPLGGPDGGDGGRGGDVVFEVDLGRQNLLDFKWSRKFLAGNGVDGGASKCKGKRGADMLIKVPPGTQIRNAETSELLLDMVRPGQRSVLLNGGHGGKGNVHYKTPTIRTPRHAGPGGPSQALEIYLELKVLADVGLVGFPNAGKSTLLSSLSSARPKIADYPFTTLIPNIGIVSWAEYKSFAMADIPGLIEGAHDGKGLGHRFLRHVERTRLLVYLLDVSAEDPEKELATLRSEIQKYSPELARRESIVVLNKSDVTTAARRKLKFDFDHQISAVTRRNLKALAIDIGQRIEKLGGEIMPWEREGAEK